jgi:hypothetical protein
MTSIKKRALIDFLDENKDLPIQGSAEWLQSRSGTIGGSEISTILNINKYQSVKQLIEQKAGISSFKKSAPLWFGNLFEYILQQYTEKLFDTKIYETGSIPYKKSKLIKYSPDGVALINKNKLKKFLNDDDYDNKIFNLSNFKNNSSEWDKKELLVLFEFKNPFMRVIKPNEIPIYYINQPKLGMEVIDICEVSIFIESVFRFCSYTDIIKINKSTGSNLTDYDINNMYNRYYHFDRNKFNNKTLAYGSFSVYYESKNNSTHLLQIINNLVEYMMNNNNIHQYDLSAIKDKKIINSIMENIIDYKDLKIIYHDICINTNINDDDEESSFYFNKYNNKNKYKNEIIENKLKICDDKNLEYLGIISFKMLDINIEPIFKSNPLNNKVLNDIEQIINVIKECDCVDDKNEKKKIINNFKLTT